MTQKLKFFQKKIKALEVLREDFYDSLVPDLLPSKVLLLPGPDLSCSSALGPRPAFAHDYY